MESSVSTVLFYLFAAVSVALAVAVVTTQRILRAAIYLMGVLVMSAAFYLMLGAEFLAGVQILVYVGGIVVLLVFAVMLTRTVDLLEEHPSAIRRLTGLVASCSFLGFTVGMLKTADFPMLKPGQNDGTAALGRKLLDYGPEGYIVPFELISLLLLAVILGGIVIARKTAPGAAKAEGAAQGAAQPAAPKVSKIAQPVGMEN